MNDPRIGVFICGCGGNISDYVDVERVSEAVEPDPGVVVSRTSMFTCSDATQQEIIETIRDEGLEGIVVASCSPKLHQETFRAMARRAGLNPYMYQQVNLREQCSWTHTHDRDGATDKGIRLVRMGIAHVRLSRPLDPIRIDTIPRVLVVGAGVAGLRAAQGLSDLGLEVHLVERENRVGGRIAEWGPLFPDEQRGDGLVADLASRIEARDDIHLYTSARITEKSGTVGDFHVTVAADRQEPRTLEVGAIVVASGFARYQPADGEFGRGLPGVVTLEEFRAALDDGGDAGPLRYDGRPVRSVVYVYCVGSRQGPDGHTFCSRFCCTAAMHTALLASERDPSLRQFHLVRDLRTYGAHELLADQALRRGSMLLEVADDDPPVVTRNGDGLHVTLHDQLTSGEEIEIEPDLVVLVTGMEAEPNDELVDVLKLPVGMDGFFNEIHPKLRPVETVLNGILIAGAAQGPKNLPESVVSAMAAVAKASALLRKGYLDLDPFVAIVDGERCTGCDECLAACPYDAIAPTPDGGRVTVHPSLCKGCGACVPFCPELALAVEGINHEQVTAMIESLAQEVR